MDEGGGGGEGEGGREEKKVNLTVKLTKYGFF